MVRTLLVSCLILASIVSSPLAAYAPGRVILKLAPAEAERLEAGIPTGNPSLDDRLRELSVSSTRRLVRPRRDGFHRDLRGRFGIEGIVVLEYEAPRDPAEVARGLGAIPGVFFAHPDHHAWLASAPNDPLYPYQYAMPRMSMPGAWDVARGDRAVVIAIMDTGTDWNHPDLRDMIWINTAEDANGNGVFDNWPAELGGDLDGTDADGNGYVDDVIGWDFVTATNVAPGEDPGPPDPDPMDFDGHGTATAGIAAATTDNGTGLAATSWGCGIMPLKVF